MDSFYHDRPHKQVRHGLDYLKEQVISLQEQCLDMTMRPGWGAFRRYVVVEWLSQAGRAGSQGQVDAQRGCDPALVAGDPRLGPYGPSRELTVRIFTPFRVSSWTVSTPYSGPRRRWIMGLFTQKSSLSSVSRSVVAVFGLESKIVGPMTMKKPQSVLGMIDAFLPGYDKHTRFLRRERLGCESFPSRAVFLS